LPVFRAGQLLSGYARYGVDCRYPRRHTRQEARFAVRYREDNPADLDRARAAGATWRDQNPAGTEQDLMAAVGGQFHRDYGVVLRAVLFAVDRHRAREVTGITTENAADVR